MRPAAAFLLSPPESHTDGAARIAPQLFGESEQSLIQRLRANDEPAYEQIYRVLRPRLVAIACEYVPMSVAEEIAQDVLALVWERRSTWPPARGLATYLYAAARNRAKDDLRHQGVVGRVAAVVTVTPSEHDIPGAGRPPGAPDAMVERAELGHAFVSALQRLPEGTRTAFTLRWVHQLGYPEVAEVMGISEGAARKQVSRARESLLAELREYVE
jgi:RNA polymerase sigma-70 factor (ECF subfamily)